MRNETVRKNIESACKDLEYSIALENLKSIPSNDSGYSDMVHYIFNHTSRSYDHGQSIVTEINIKALIHFELYFFAVTNDVSRMRVLLAYYSGMQEIKYALLKHTDYYGNGILLDTCIIGNSEIVSRLLDYCAGNGIYGLDDNQSPNGLIINLIHGTTVFHMAAKFGRSDVFRVLLEHPYSRQHLLPLIKMKSASGQSLLDFAAVDERNKFIAFLRSCFPTVYDQMSLYVERSTWLYLIREKKRIQEIESEITAQSCQLFFANRFLAYASNCNINPDYLVGFYTLCCEDVRRTSIKSLDALSKHKRMLEQKSITPRVMHSCLQQNCHFKQGLGLQWMNDFIDKTVEDVSRFSTNDDEVSLVFFGSGWLLREFSVLRKLSNWRHYETLNIFCVDSLYNHRKETSSTVSIDVFSSHYFSDCFNVLEKDFLDQVMKLELCENVNLRLLPSVDGIESDLLHGAIFFIALDFDVTMKVGVEKVSLESLLLSYQLLSHLQTDKNPLYLYLSIQVFKMVEKISSEYGSTFDPVPFQVRQWRGQLADYSLMQSFFSLDSEDLKSSSEEQSDFYTEIHSVDP